MVDHDFCDAAGLQNSENLLDRARCVGAVVDDAPRVNDVEAVGLEREVLGVSDAQIALESKRIESTRGQLYSVRCQIDTGQDSSCLCEALVVRAETDAYLENS